MPALVDRATSTIEDEIATLASSIAAATGRFIELLAELDRREAWAEEGFTSLAHWLSWRCGIDLRTAREHVRVARASRELPKTTAALREGEISYSKARAITRVARPETETELLEIAKNATAVQLDRILARARRADPPAETDRSKTIEDRRTTEYFWDEHGMLVVRARLAPEEGALFVRALDSARDALFREPPKDRDPAQLRADALALVADRSLSETAAAREGSDRVMVMVHVDAAVLADTAADGQSYLEHGPQAPAGASQRLACDASIVEVAHEADGGVEVGRRSRVVSRALRRALHLRDGGTCTFPGCSHRIVDAHHVSHWAQGGATRLDNLLLLCRFHHGLVHEQGYRAELTSSGPRFYRPNGSAVPDAPPRGSPSDLDPAGDPLALVPHAYAPRIDWGVVLDGVR